MSFGHKAYHSIRLFTTKYTSYGSIFDNKTNSISFDKQIEIFDLTKLTADQRLQRLYFFVISEYINRRMYSSYTDNTKQYIGYDECWKFLSNPISAEIIESNFRTARKYGNTIFCLSQTVSDFIDKPYTNAILENAPFKFILRQGGNLEKLAKLNINPTEITAIKSLKTIDKEYADIFVKTETASSLIWRLRPTLEELSSYSNDFESRKTHVM